VLVCAVLAGCGGGSSGEDTSATSPPRPPSVAEARKIIDPYLYELDKACPTTWLPSAQARCRSTAAKLKALLTKRAFRLPKRGKLPYAAGGVEGGAVSFELGNRQPYPGSGSIFTAAVTLRRSGDRWLIESFGTP
jgi:hypothetical protein